MKRMEYNLIFYDSLNVFKMYKSSLYENLAKVELYNTYSSQFVVIVFKLSLVLETLSAKNIYFWFPLRF